MKKIGFAFKVEPSWCVVIMGLLLATCAIALTFLQGFHVIDAPVLIESLLGGGGAVFLVGIMIYAIPKWFQIWRKANYGDERKFKFWSPQIRGEGDKDLTKGSSLKNWKKIIVLKPTGDPKTTFSMGFKDIFGNTKISRAERRVEEGPFGMRMGPEDCDFFIASNKAEVGLEIAGYFDFRDRTRPKLPIY